MQLKIANCPDKNFKPYVEEAVRFYAKELLPSNRIRNNCSILVRFTDKISEYGYASVKGYNRSKCARKFLIEIHPGIGVRKILETLAHEMVHVKQYALNELNADLTSWCDKKVDSNNLEYWLQPWEIDAFGREPGLLYKYVTKHMLWEIFDEFNDPNTPIVSVPIKWKI